MSRSRLPYALSFRGPTTREVAVGGPVGEGSGRRALHALQVVRHRHRARRRARGRGRRGTRRCRSSPGRTQTVQIAPISRRPRRGRRGRAPGRRAPVDDRVDHRALRRRRYDGRDHAVPLDHARALRRAADEVDEVAQAVEDAVDHVTVAPASRSSSSARSESPWLDVHAAHAGAVDRHLEALAQRVERRVLHAVVGGEPDDRDPSIPCARAAPRRGPCPRSPSSRPSRGPCPCRRSRRSARGRARVQLGALGALDAVRAATARPAPRTSRGRPDASRGWRPRGRSEGRRPARSPGRRSRSPVRHGERPAGREVVLEVDDQERLRHRLR